MKIEESIELTRQGFEASFKEQSLYNKQTQSEEHIRQILDALGISGKQTVLDLGTGSGYLAFALAEKQRDSRVVGLDIVEQTLDDNRKKAVGQRIENISFVSYDGINFPFPDETFDFVVTRYALHHFPDITKAFSEIRRVLKKQGTFFLSDPTPNANDTERFVDDYMGMKKDGHIKYYTKDEFVSLAQQAGMRLIDGFDTEISFPRLKETAIGFDEIMEKHSKEIIDRYQVRVTDDQTYIYITQKVLNLIFQKNETV